MIRDFTIHMYAASKSQQTIKKRVYDIERLARVFDLTTVTLDDLERHLASRAHLAPATRSGMVSSWRKFFAWAHARGLITENPTDGLETIKVPHRRPRVAPDEEIARSIAGAPDDVRAMVLLARLACLRLTELTELPLDAREGERLRIIGKGNKERIVYLHPELQAVLSALEHERRGQRYYFPGRFGGAMHPMSVNKIITRTTGWNPHSLRHAGATAAYQATRDLRAVQLMLGHASLATTQRYLHIDEDAMRAVALGTSMRRQPRRAA